ncbi:MAG TPA: glycoside hydrolase family 15 protein [Gaiellaceae bacterium]|nr:glycoside hydrolase family 15 protein [Gaiellaceae bacterium]
MRIEDYALIGDLQTAALVSRSGSIDWCCFPRFDSGACFAALLGDPNNGRWIVAPKTEIERTTRRYRHDTLILESVHTTAEGAVRLIDFMPPRGEAPDIVRIVEGLDGRVPMRSELVIRFDYGRTVPWVRRVDHARVAVAGPDALCFRTEVEVHGEDLRTVAEFEVEAGERISFVLTWFPSHEEIPDAIDAERALTESEDYWLDWAGKCGHQGDYHEEIHQSLLVLKALTYAPTGGIVAAPTTSLPENVGGVRNWDYRFCWLRDATLTLLAMLNAGYSDEAEAWRGWLLRAVAGDPADLQIMYGLAGERRLEELELDWLAGFADSKPVRIGNAASKQLQLDVYGEMLDALYHSRVHGLPPDDFAWAVVLKVLEWLEEGWRQEDCGIWEVRGPTRHFTHSKVMAWVAFDRAIRFHEEFDRKGPVDRWRTLRDEIHGEVLEHGWSEGKQSFTQSYGSDELDASLLMLPIVGFLPAGDDRVVSTVDAIRRELTVDGLVLRYRVGEHAADDGLPGDEGVFLPCSFWLAQVLALQGHHEAARELFERLLDLRNDVGLLSEEYDPRAGRQLGNFPQAFTHLALVDAAIALGQGRAIRR